MPKGNKQYARQPRYFYATKVKYLVTWNEGYGKSGVPKTKKKTVFATESIGAINTVKIALERKDKMFSKIKRTHWKAIAYQQISKRRIAKKKR